MAGGAPAAQPQVVRHTPGLTFTCHPECTLRRLFLERLTMFPRILTPVLFGHSGSGNWPPLAVGPALALLVLSLATAYRRSLGALPVLRTAWRPPNRVVLAACTLARLTRGWTRRPQLFQRSLDFNISGRRSAA